jgi:tRNA pseudouridine32 synthase/23S rRNA pseudouridine746 synthase
MRPARPGEPGAKAARTVLRRLEVFEAAAGVGPLALVEALPQTGRTHQIRVHLAAAGWPLAIDPDYGDPGPVALPGGLRLARTPLHAAGLGFAHPATGAPVEVEAPLADDLAAAVAALRSLSPAG